MDKQSFSLNADFLGGYTGIFIKIVIAIILMYGFILLLNFFRDKFLNKGETGSNPQIIDLLSILDKLFCWSGFGFIAGNILELILSRITRSSVTNHGMSFRGDWDYLTFGVILIFVGIGFRMAQKSISKEKQL